MAIARSRDHAMNFAALWIARVGLNQPNSDSITNTGRIQRIYQRRQRLSPALFDDGLYAARARRVDIFVLLQDTFAVGLTPVVDRLLHDQHCNVDICNESEFRENELLDRVSQAGLSSQTSKRPGYGEQLCKV